MEDKRGRERGRKGGAAWDCGLHEIPNKRIREDEGDEISNKRMREDEGDEIPNKE